MNSEDSSQLRILSIFHYVIGGFGCLVSFFPVIHLILGLTMVFAPGEFENDAEFPAVIGYIFAGIAAIIIFAGLTGSICVILAGRFLASRRHYTFCLVIAAVECFFMPLGTILGVFTIVVLMRESVKESFGQGTGVSG